LTNLTNRIGLHTWTLDTTPLPDVLRIARNTGYNAVELRHVDFVRCLEAGMSNDEVLDMIRASGLVVSCVGLETGMLFAQGAEAKRFFDSMDVMCARAAALDCEVMMVAPGSNPATNVKDAARNFATGCEIAAKYGLLCALEFGSRHPVVNRLAVAREIVALAKSRGLAIIHFPLRPSRFNLLAVPRVSGLSVDNRGTDHDFAVMLPAYFKTPLPSAAAINASASFCNKNFCATALAAAFFTAAT